MTAVNHKEARKGNSRFPFRRLIVPALFVAALFAVTVFRDRPTSGPAPAVWTFSGRTMGTAYNVKVVAPDLDDSAKLAIHTAIREAVDGVDDTMSTFKPQSELSRFNSSGTEEFPVSENLVRVVTEALEVAELSEGALDVTVGPLVDAWGFGPDGWTVVPDDVTLDALREAVGWRKLVLDREALSLRKTTEGLRIDLSAIAKGFAVDRVFSGVVELGYPDLMVEIGGEVRTAGLNEGGGPWRIGIERPDEEGRVAGFAIELSGISLATSGDYRNFRDVDGHRISHTIDPRTGRPIEHRLASVSVVASTCMEADAWATALNVLGPIEGFSVAEREGIRAFFLVRTSSGFDEKATSEFPVRLSR
ncbi:MAG: FAD:protein FMN transferase [Thermoanaerobaculales bacterium]|nr:FAD:protein FMN transferase [Thermoanaerobaculales bacterium]